VLISLIFTRKEISARVGLEKVASGEQSNGTSNNPPNSTNHTVASPGRASSPHSESSAVVNDYLVGSGLDDALATGQDMAISWPFADGDIRDWTQAEAIWCVISV
jgi:actin-related protein 9